jgi:hypothetical protein
MPRRRRQRIGYEKSRSPFVMLPNHMTNCEAWKRLSFKAAWVYIEMRKKFKGHNENNITLSYREMKWKLASASFWMAIQELVEYGFIKIVKHGGLYRNATIYGLDKRWERISKNPDALAEIEEKLNRMRRIRRWGRRRPSGHG